MYLLSPIFKKFCCISALQVEGGANVSIKATWSQRIVYELDQFCLRIPFSFPHYVNPVGKKISKREKISLNINPGTTIEVLCKSSSHPLKVTHYHKICFIYWGSAQRIHAFLVYLQNLKRQAGKLSLSYEAEVPVWSSLDFSFSYSVRIWTIS